ncbi:hypothetical protein Pla22_15820 [Rubripirellula amarantea]|uniref:Uncharacterized protein n=1 Tax=Rubripirellula amarantea TaxID=2527999 RepID=A0A5C5WTR3_9BACT|nr:hypothetical protein [Rubripirellula amarantea]TWT53948.1 hypothetical protein Pla22_15820 [Rubripirellula amarantea]
MISKYTTITRANSALLLTLLSVVMFAGGVFAAPPIISASIGQPGQPYGVGLIEIPLDVPIVGQVPPPLQVSDPSHRIFYPFSEDVRIEVPRPSQRPVPQPGRGRLLGRLGNLIREIANDDAEPQYQTVSRRVTFLFIGDSPLNVRLSDARGVLGTFDVVPTNDPVAHGRIIQDWWAGYTDAAHRQINAADYPPWVETYLVAMLSGRLGLPLPDWYLQTDAQEDQLLSTLKLVGGVEGVGEAIFRKHAAGLDHLGASAGDTASASVPLPPPPRWSPLYDNPALQSVSVEPLATRVPPECFYIRYGSFANYLWFRDLSDEYGGDLSKMMTLRGIDNDAAKRVEDQLNVKTTELSRVLGPTVIEDQAIIGRDLFLADGASMGVLFKATNAFLLRTSLNGDRTKLARDHDHVTLDDITISGTPATFLSSADNRVRSYMVEDGGYILITNSFHIAERFLEVGDSQQSLASTASFKLARQLMPLERNDTIFAYFSPEMLRGLVSPQYLIELRRRLSAKSEIAMVRLSHLAASQEGVIAPENDTLGIPGLTSAGFLPTGFGTRPDGSGTVEVGDDVMDTRRGARGTFLPIADVEMDRVTAEEAAWYARIASEYTHRFPTFDPVMVGLQREPVDPATGVERLTIHAEIAPLDAGKYGKWSRQLGPPTRVAMQFAPDDIVALQAHVASEQLGPPTHLFGAIKDSVPPEPEDFDGILNIYRSLKEIPGYLGAWPQPGALDRLPLGLGRGTPVGPGMSRLIGGLYRYTDGSFSILSFWPDILQASLPHLEAVDVSDDAQIRIRIGNLQGSQLQGWVNEQLYERSRQSSVAGAGFLSLLTRQLGVEPEDVERATRQILGADLQCTLGGDYLYSNVSHRWISTAWQGELAALSAPLGYQAPAMKWFRGAAGSVTQYEDRVIADVTVDIARQ